MDTVLRDRPAIRSVAASSYTIPTDAPEADGTRADPPGLGRAPLHLAEIIARGLQEDA